MTLKLEKANFIIIKVSFDKFYMYICINEIVNVRNFFSVNKILNISLVTQIIKN